MKKIVILVFVFLLLSCVDHPDISNINLSEIENSIQEIPNKSESRVLTDNEIPKALQELYPKQVYITHTGIYIVLKSSFGSESGLFWSDKFGGGSITSMSSSNGFLPEFVHLEGNMFTFKRE